MLNGSKLITWQTLCNLFCGFRNVLFVEGLSISELLKS